MTIIAAADGSALGNPGPAGWAWYIDESRWRCGGWARGTNNQGELTAVLDLLRQTAHYPEPLHILCDSQYVINSVTKWMAGWKRKGWKKADGKPVLNVEVMKALDEAMAGREVTFEWVKGHAGHALNEKADILANGAAKAHAARREPEAGPGFPGARSVGAGDDPAVPPAVDGGTRTGTPAAARAAAAPPSGTMGTADIEPDLFSLTDHEAAASPPGSGAQPSTPTLSAPDQSAVDLVAALERSLLDDAVRADRRRLEELLDPSWSHVCARGEVWSRADRLAACGSPDQASGERTMEILEARQLTSDTVLLVWRERSRGGQILRSSVWVRSRDSWRQTFQQGTAEA
ncbi:ribonuclease HI [Dietzia sp. UCD-THP]|uniref:RNase H family protein n=1 Tax=Dietzia sp. UCD-THP TaxID=1292020 RepID=UPI000382F32C|nr:RNase H family protein [Dietzia sp. UCD-THP]EYT64176.1 ribonuclease HI [Dietzia sp. UCD-THP]